MIVQSEATPCSLAASPHTYTGSLKTIFLHFFLPHSMTHREQSLHFKHEPTAAYSRCGKIVLLSCAMELKM